MQQKWIGETDATRLCQGDSAEDPVRRESAKEWRTQQKPICASTHSRGNIQ
jgi:hypothetical protein